MKKKELPFICLLGISGGFFLSFMYINPYFGTISLSELVLQLSGSRGEFPLELSLIEIVSFSMRLIPVNIFQIYFGISLYRHFCTASIYVFSRCPDRIKWYMKEMATLWIHTCMFNLTELLCSILVTNIRYEIKVDFAGIYLLIFHFLIFSLWIYATTILINLLALHLGSGNSFLMTTILQYTFTALLCIGNITDKYINIPINSKSSLLNLNPISHLVLGWQRSTIKEIDKVIDSPYNIHLYQSVLLYICICIILFLSGMIIIKKHELIISDSEMRNL